VVVLDALARGEVVAHQPSADPGDLGGTHRRSDTTTADSHTALDSPSGYSPAERDHKVGIVVTRVQLMRTEVNYFMPRRPQTSDQIFLQSKPTMIRGNSYAHAILLA
jgi:hypothetical protein